MIINREALEILKKILEAQNQLYGKEIEIVEHKIEAVKKDDTDFLIEETEREREIVSKVSTLEDNRIRLIEKLGYGKLNELIKNISDESLKKAFINLREELTYKLNKLKELNDILKELILITNDVIEFTLNELTGLKEVGYKGDKKKNKMTSGNILNRKG